MSDNKSNHWYPTWNLIRNLWPRWTPNDAEAMLWRDTFERLDQETMRLAIAAARRSSVYGEPGIHELMECFRKAATDRRNEWRAYHGAADHQAERDAIPCPYESGMLEAVRKRFTDLHGREPKTGGLYADDR